MTERRTSPLALAVVTVAVAGVTGAAVGGVAWTLDWASNDQVSVENPDRIDPIAFGEGRPLPSPSRHSEAPATTGPMAVPNGGVAAPGIFPGISPRPTNAPSRLGAQADGRRAVPTTGDSRASGGIPVPISGATPPRGTMDPPATPPTAPPATPPATPPAGTITNPGPDHPSPAGPNPADPPGRVPADQPTGIPAGQPRWTAGDEPNRAPADQPNRIPTDQPSRTPAGQPNGLPVGQPTRIPAGPAVGPIAAPVARGVQVAEEPRPGPEPSESGAGRSRPRRNPDARKTDPSKSLQWSLRVRFARAGWPFSAR